MGGNIANLFRICRGLFGAGAQWEPLNTAAMRHHEKTLWDSSEWEGYLGGLVAFGPHPLDLVDSLSLTYFLSLGLRPHQFIDAFGSIIHWYSANATYSAGGREHRDRGGGGARASASGGASTTTWPDACNI